MAGDLGGSAEVLVGVLEAGDQEPHQVGAAGRIKRTAEQFGFERGAGVSWCGQERLEKCGIG